VRDVKKEGIKLTEKAHENKKRERHQSKDSKIVPFLFKEL